jgi:hypothetical protein
MSKKAVTWMDVIREQLAKMRKEGKSPSIGDVTPYAKKEWEQIKAGKHPLYMQGTSKGTNKGSKGRSNSKGNNKSKKNKTQKIMKGNKNMGSNMGSNMAINQMLSKVHLCKKDMAKIQKYLKTQKGGDCKCGQTGGGEGCGCDQSGGKRRTRKMKIKGKKMNGKKMKGGDDDMKEPYVDFTGKDGLEELNEDTDGTQEDIQKVE